MVKTASNVTVRTSVEELTDALKRVHPAVKDMKHVESDHIRLVSADHERIRICASGDVLDLAVEISGNGRLDGCVEVSYARLVRAAKALPINSDVKIVVNDDVLELKAGNRSIEVDCQYLLDEEELHDAHHLATFSASELARALKIASACARQNTPPGEPLGCIAMEISDTQFDFVGTDRHRMVSRRLKADISNYADRPEIVLIPSAPAKALIEVVDQGVAEDVHLELIDQAHGYQRLHCVVGAVDWSSALVEGSFPSWRQALPREVSGKLVFERKETLSFLAAVQTFSKHTSMKRSYQKNAPLLYFSINQDDVLTVSYSESETGTIEDRLEGAEVEVQDRESFSLNVQPAFLFDLFDAIRGEHVSLDLKLPTGPLLYQGEEITYILMPALRGR